MTPEYHDSNWMPAIPPRAHLPPSCDAVSTHRPEMLETKSQTQDSHETVERSKYQVFALPELLELILGYLDIRTLLLASRVCRTFQDTIQGSPRLQRALYLQSLNTCRNVPSYSPEINPLLDQFAAHGCIKTVFIVAGYEWRLQYPGVGSAAALEAGLRAQTEGVSDSTSPLVYLPLTVRRPRPLTKRGTERGHVLGSWRNMCVSSSACAVVVEIGDSGGARKRGVSQRWVCEGRTFGEVLEYAATMHAKTAWVRRRATVKYRCGCVLGFALNWVLLMIIIGWGAFFFSMFFWK